MARAGVRYAPSEISDARSESDIASGSPKSWRHVIQEPSAKWAWTDSVPPDLRPPLTDRISKSKGDKRGHRQFNEWQENLDSCSGAAGLPTYLLHRAVGNEDYGLRHKSEQLLDLHAGKPSVTKIRRGRRAPSKGAKWAGGTLDIGEMGLMPTAAARTMKEHHVRPRSQPPQLTPPFATGVNSSRSFEDNAGVNSSRTFEYNGRQVKTQGVQAGARGAKESAATPRRQPERSVTPRHAFAPGPRGQVQTLALGRGSSAPALHRESDGGSVRAAGIDTGHRAFGGPSPKPNVKGKRAWR
eukprot:TRINITY_DN81809_c0_g1_i1.p1 TRINITY_DN81809_c0_g1~~TRINITY_DN81809_c0_g1_i1.p1  ORF type:complete len:298 (-),score=14.46 TRINITY_DN81809_c0_g1_i1:213-1106(-)